ncbi:molybdenum cofactor biosynthesis protein MoaB [Methanoplanus sp. FWC-SCC4]|uniref:Molybdenum cofactor biosynthesis protein MoaB n=1 Tax=Methanochimaera problematica TaxID=2609417 RepID=A0AA97FCI7_9EURY|nr:molybdenum cofactor biosynthesis protein B [Methanoplanus sp. FWC-SCC4]WOF16007.1 molybdenum cofactor biosynthesis protein MoaB [Methanoplanus sp. FWC-SCC4]
MDPTHIEDIIINCAVITVSTSRDENSDISGKKIIKLLENANLPVVFYKVIPDDLEKIQLVCKEALLSANCVILSGGTGLTHDDCTIEAISPILDKKIDGFGELFRLKSYEDIGTRALLSRAVGGVIDKKAVFCIPGSTGAVTMALKDIIIPEIRHILTHAGK